MWHDGRCAKDLNRYGVCVRGQHGVFWFETRQYSPATVEGRKDGERVTEVFCLGYR